MVIEGCPWCEEDVTVEPAAAPAEERCEACSTTWLVVELAAEELALAA